MFEKIKQLIAAARSGDWKTAVKIALGLILDGIDLLPDPAAPKLTNDPIAELEVLMKEPGIEANGEFLKRLMPILLALLQKYLGL